MLLILIAACLLAFAVISSQPLEDGWSEKASKKIYIVNGKPVTGWQEIGGHQYYFDEESFMVTGWKELDGQRYYFDDSGCMFTGWLADAHYFHPDGTLATGWLELDGRQYYLGDDGRTKKGVVEVDGRKYLLGEQGFVSCGWTTVLGQLYYADSEGCPVQGWQEIDGKMHYFEESGAAASGWMELDGITHYFYTDGAPAQGHLTIDGQAYHLASNGQLIYLVNPWNYLPEDYTVELTPISETHQIAAIAYEDFLDMVTACEAAGFEPAVCSSYRTQEYQEKLYQNRIARYVQAGNSVEKATELAGRSVAVPGTSEHQLGLALDLVDNKNWRLDESQAKTPTQQWLMENSWRYGWILRYPNEKSEITGIIYEPWHYRYVGKTIAKEIHELDVCLEEYLDMLTNSVG